MPKEASEAPCPSPGRRPLGGASKQRMGQNRAASGAPASDRARARCRGPACSVAGRHHCLASECRCSAHGPT
eukprot:11496898-Alexandrium_andersonii.AAC.1